ncbi:MAG: hypothetical protein HFF06_00445 [Oscillospiraceae bacterium]|jgi:hypothetical protein|nr:hypothetical protein [Oscillospiraceae bacterium]
MFGYVRAREDTLSPEDRAAYQSVYCGLCHTLKREYGNIPRLFLNYDFAFLAMVLAPVEERGNAGCLRCPMHPWKGRGVCPGGEWLKTAAGESVILTWWKLRDTVADGGFFARMGAQFLSLLLRPAYRKARTRYLDFDRETTLLLEEQRSLEREECTSIDRTADCFARLLGAAIPRTGEEKVDRPRAQLLYHLGRWIYLMDAVDDLEEDRKRGSYNPVAARFLDWSREEQTYLRQSMDHSLALMGAAFELLPPNPWNGVMENIIYSGLPNVEELVFSGKWRERQTKRRRNDG